MDISTVRAIMEEARSRLPPEPRHVVPDAIEPPLKQIDGPDEPEPALDAEYVASDGEPSSSEPPVESEFLDIAALRQAARPDDQSG